MDIKSLNLEVEGIVKDYLESPYDALTSTHFTYIEAEDAESPHAHTETSQTLYQGLLDVFRANGILRPIHSFYRQNRYNLFALTTDSQIIEGTCFLFVITHNRHLDVLGDTAQNFQQYGDWIDLRISKRIVAKAGDIVHVNLNFAADLPPHYEAHMVARSSTFPKYGLILGNAIGIIDNSYNGPDDLWQANFYATRDVEIEELTRLLQFRIVRTMSHPKTPERAHLVRIINNPYILEQNQNRGGIGSSGTR